MSKNIITIFGATGQQGGSVVETFLNDAKLNSNWQVRGVTRNTSSDKAKALTSRGAEVVAADSDDKASLVKAMTGASAVFAVTNYWDHADMKREIQQGKNLADAAVEAGVDHYIWSSLLNVNKVSNGVLKNVYHFDGKAEIEEYVRSLPLSSSFYLAGFYMSNLPGMFQPNADGKGNTLMFPFSADTGISLVDTTGDTGKFVKGMILKKDQVLGKRVLGAFADVSPNEMIATVERIYPGAAGKLKFQEVSNEAFHGAFPGPEYIKTEMTENMRLIGEFGYFGKASLAESHAILEDPLTTWEDFVKKTNFFAEL